MDARDAELLAGVAAAQQNRLASRGLFHLQRFQRAGIAQTTPGR
jgi:hypothetical protein